MRKALIGLVVSCALPAPAGAAGRGDEVLKQIGASRGICVLLGDERCELAIDLARRSGLTMVVKANDAQTAASASRAADEAGLYGTRIFVAREAPGLIGLADGLADALVDASGGLVAGPSQAEVLRVLRPGGKAVLAGGVLTAPARAGTDDWTHGYHGPDNNPQSKDRLARAPYLTQFVAEPRYAPAPQAAVAAGGRVFMAFGHVAWHQREEPWLDTLVAMSGHNGAILWKRPLPTGIMVDRSTMIATPDVLYLADDKSCRLIDPATGKVTGEIAPPAELTGGTFWKWMALSDSVLYALVGQAEPADPVKRWRRTAHGWPWGGVSAGYNQGEYAWGFARTLVAMDPAGGKVLWHHSEEALIDSRSLCIAGGRVFLCSFGKYLACLDASTGKELWRRTIEKDADLFKAIGPYRPGHGYVGGWKSTVYLKATDKAVYFIGPQVHHITAVSADEGRLLWADDQRDLHVVIREDGLYAIAPQKGAGAASRRLDPLTGKVLGEFPISRRACTRSTGTADGVLFRAAEGTLRLDAATGRSQWISPMRPSCFTGVLAAAGHLYWVPWTCDCNLQMFGVIALAPAGEFRFDQQAGPDRLEKGPAFDVNRQSAIGNRQFDWPTYRADSARSGRTAAAVAADARLLWKWAPPAKMTPTAPVAAGDMAYLAGSDGVVRALDAATGREAWRAYTGGAVLYPPTVAAGRALVGSADGWAWAFDAADGRLAWRFRAAPAERRIAVYGRIQSTWPVAAGVLVEGGTAYLAAGMNNFDGTYVYALDAATGAIKWQNNSSGHLDAFGRRGVGVQGDLLLTGGRLYLAGGNAVSPGVFDAATGKCLNKPPGPGTPAVRGRELHAAGDKVAISGQPLYSTADAPVYDRACQWRPVEVTAGNATLSLAPAAEAAGGWALTCRGSGEGGPSWTQPLPAEPVRRGIAVDAAGRIIVTLTDGQVLCFGEKKD